MVDSFSGYETGGTRGLQPGSMLGMFQLREPLGRGGMGQVWQARDTQGKREVAIKLLPPELKGNAEAIDQVTAAFQVVHALTHQHIGKTIGLFDDAEHGPYIVMDLVRGVPLSKYARDYRAAHKAMPVERVVKLLKPVAAALDYAHRKMVLHRDIKPQNILVQHRADFSIEDVILIDFGLAAEIRSTMARYSKGTIDVSGTRPYMSPEQLRGKPGQWDGRSDQYSLAVVAYELLAGHLPFESEDDMALMLAILNEPPDPIPGLPASVNGALLKGLSKSKEERAAACVALIDSLKGKVVAPSAEPPPRRVTSGAKDPAGKKPVSANPDEVPSKPRSSERAQQLRRVLLEDMLDGQTRQAYLAARTHREIQQDEQEGRSEGLASLWLPAAIGVVLVVFIILVSGIPAMALSAFGAVIPMCLTPFRFASLWKKYGPMPRSVSRKWERNIQETLFQNSR